MMENSSKFWEKLSDPLQRPFAVELDSPAGPDVTKFMAGARELRGHGAELITVADCPMGRVRADAGIMACKKTSDIIPLCHPLPITKASVALEILEEKTAIRAVCTVKTEGKTGVEMEALTGVSAALLTIYDMCKAVSKEMVIGGVHLVKKSGGKSGDFFFGREGTRL